MNTNMEAQARGGAKRKANAKADLVSRCKAGNPKPSALLAVTRWAREDGISVAQWCEAHGISVPVRDQSDRQRRVRAIGAREVGGGGNLEKLCQEAAVMLCEDGDDGRWVLVGLLYVAGRLPPPKGCDEYKRREAA